jgi:4a-hydroxytetrahydrobiopterin dehydratase
MKFSFRTCSAFTFAVALCGVAGLAELPTTKTGLAPVNAISDTSRTRALSGQEIRAELATLPGWEAEEGMAGKTYSFPGFSDAVAFIVRISHPLEAMAHHPEIRNVYGKVYVGFTTHDQGNKITDLDFKAARAVEAIAAKLPQKAPSN